MALWNKVLSGFNNEEETVNFGTRKITENNGSLYETSTIATIQSDREVTTKPNVLASVQHSRVCVAIDQSITIFENGTCENILLNVSFGLLITCYSISHDGSFLFVVLSNGILYCIHLNKGQVVFTKNIAGGCTIIRIFLQNKFDEHLDVYLVTKKGEIYRISQFNVKLVNSIVSNEFDVDDTLKELTEQIGCEQIFRGFSYDEIIYATIGVTNGEVSIVMLSCNTLFMWSSEQYNSFNTSQNRYLKVKLFKNHHAMLALNTDHTLSIVCPQTLLGIKVYSEPITDFEIIENNDNNSCEIIVLTKNGFDCTTYALHVLLYPGFKEKFQINLKTATYLVEIMDHYDEIILYLEGIKDFGQNNEYITSIRVKTIVEGIPDFQLQRLLRKQQFDAAQIFANKFNLSAEPIYCAKAALILSQMGPWGKKISCPTQIDELLRLFDQVTNVQYVVECCSKALIPDYKQMRKVHLYARSRIIANTAKDDKYLDLLSLINNILHKLETFHMIWGYQGNSECYDEHTMNEWIRFTKANLMEEYKTHLSLGEMEAATLIWARHIPDVMKHVSIETVRDIFAIIPEKTPLVALWPWLLHFIPNLLSIIPNAINEIIIWGCKKVRSFEQSHPSEWPQIGIDFAKKFIKLLKLEEGYESPYIYQEYLNKDSNSKLLISLIQAMSDIQKLKINYRLTMFLDSYIGDPTEVSYMLLDKAHVDVIPEFVNTFLKQYMLNNTLKNDDIFSSYIQKTIMHSKSWWSGEVALWEKKVVVIINLIHNIEIKLLQTLEVLKKACVPWSSDIVSLAENSCNYDHALATEIRIEYNCLPIKLILKKYGYERIGMNNKLIYRIIKENYDTMIIDIQQITKNDLSLRKKAFSSCISHFLCRRDFENVTKVLNCLEDDVLLYCCAQIVNYIIAGLTLKIIPDSVTYHIDMLGWVKFQLEKLSKECKTHSVSCYNIISSINEIRSMYFLKKDFKINVTLQEYQSKKQQILEEYIEKHYDEHLENTNEEKELLFLYKKINKIADLIQFQRIGAVSLLLEHTKNLNFLKYFYRYENGPLYLLAEECRYVYKICMSIIQYAKIQEDLAITAKNLNSAALWACFDDDLQSMLLLSIWTNLYLQCSNKNIRCGPNSTDMQYQEVPQSNWKLYTIYKDLAIAANEHVLSLFRDIIAVQKYCIIYPEYIKCEATDADVEHDKLINREEPLKQLLLKIKKIKAEQNEYCLLQIIKTLYIISLCIHSDKDYALLMEIKAVYFQSLLALLRKLITTRIFDLQLGLSCVFMLSDSEASRWISVTGKSFQPDCTRHLRIIILGYEYYRLTKNQSILEVFKNNKLLHSWADKLSKYTISYKEFLTSDAATKREILQRIMSYDDNMVPILQEFCLDFGFDTQDCLLLYLKTIINAWNPKLNIKNNNRWNELQINEDEVNELKRKCNAIAVHISDKNALKNCVTLILSHVNFYLYEIFIILMDLIEDNNIEHRNYFCFLQNYTRTSQPTQIEFDEWMHLNPGHTILPPIAKWRMPFLPKVELWKLITPELNLKTYEKWLDIAPILKLQSHIICTLAIKGEVACTWGSKYNISTWSLFEKNSTLLNDIKKCIERMTGPDALYYGTAALYYVVNHTPSGADKVAAIEECYKLAQEAALKSTIFEEGMLEKIKFKYLRFTSEHILHTHGLGNKMYLSLIDNPDKLIRELYADDSIPQRYRCVTDHRPDINSAVNCISQLFSINVLKLRVDLLQEWLQPDTQYIKFNQSVTETFSIMAHSEGNLSCDDNVLRACYVLEHGDLELSANFLINIVFNDDNEDYSPETRYRALHILQSIVDMAKLEDITKRDNQTIRRYMKSLKYIGKLESLGIGYNINTFDTCSKQELIEILWKTQRYSSQTFVIIAQLCIDFKIFEYSLWDKNLIELAKLRMIKELKQILIQVRHIGTIVNTNGYLLGWELIISEPFRKLDIHPTPEQIKNCIDALQLVYSCPIVHMLNFHDIIQYCFQCQLPHLALVLLPFLNENDTKWILKKLCDAPNTAEILEHMNNLVLNGVLCLTYCKQIVENAMCQKNI